MKNRAYQLWSHLWKAAGLQLDPQPCFERLWHAYGESHRHYHNLNHIMECLEAFHPVHQLASDPVAVEMAIWFHDAVYDPKAHDNEEQSAALAKQWLFPAMGNTPLLDLVSNLVLATKKHLPGNDVNAAIMIDVDLGILGQAAGRFQEYEAQIRQEYAWVSPAIFAARRAEILEHFLSRERIYLTDYFHARYEAPARANIAHSLQVLRTGLPE